MTSPGGACAYEYISGSASLRPVCADAKARITSVVGDGLASRDSTEYASDISAMKTDARRSSTAKLVAVGDSEANCEVRRASITRQSVGNIIIVIDVK